MALVTVKQLFDKTLQVRFPCRPAMEFISRMSQIVDGGFANQQTKTIDFPDNSYSSLKQFLDNEFGAVNIEWVKFIPQLHSHTKPHYHIGGSYYKKSTPPPVKPVVLNPVQQAYKTLGVAPGTSMVDIKKKWKALAVANHPDHNNNKESLARMSKINNAYQTLVKVLN